MNHQCRGDLCGICERRVEQEEDRRAGRSHYTPRTLDRMADDQAERECGPR